MGGKLFKKLRGNFEQVCNHRDALFVNGGLRYHSGMVTQRVEKIAVTAALSAIVLVLQITGLGFIPFPGVSLTIMHVPVIIAAILEGPLCGLFTGFLFGIFTIIRAATAPATPLDAVFVNPLISVLPRLFIGPAAWLVYTLIRGKKSAPAEESGSRPVDISAFARVRENAAIAAGTIAGSLTNTTLVLSALAVFGSLPAPDGQGVLHIILGIVMANGLFEAGFAAFIVLAIVAAWKNLPGGKSKLSKIKSADGE
jgi:uncharacterized membrane protein